LVLGGAQKVPPQPGAPPKEMPLKPKDPQKEGPNPSALKTWALKNTPTGGSRPKWNKKRERGVPLGNPGHRETQKP